MHFGVQFQSMFLSVAVPCCVDINVGWVVGDLNKRFQVVVHIHDLHFIEVDTAHSDLHTIGCLSSQNG